MKDQFVVACIDRPADAPSVLAWARHFAERLNHKGIIALHVGKERGDDGWLEALGVPFASLVGDWSTAIGGLPTAFKGILAVAPHDPTAPRTALAHPATLLRHFRQCRIAYLCVPTGAPPVVDTSRACLTLTHQREGKEKLVWASYLFRLLGSRITIATPDYRDQGLRSRLQNNLRFADKVLPEREGGRTKYEVAALRATTRVDLAAAGEQGGLLIAMTTDPREQDLIDHLLPRQERLLLKRFPRLPVLFLNPRDDLYILCD
ncbi:MAG: hypothetical protein J6I49_09360 [Bacteroidales bacterium]|nr:hypothetical protein [Bacteroidales bacterium]